MCRWALPREALGYLLDKLAEDLARLLAEGVREWHDLLGEERPHGDREGGLELSFSSCALKPQNCDLVVRVSGPDIPGFEERYQPLYPFLTPPIKAVWNAAETVVAKCEAEADLIRDVDPGVEVTIIPNGVDTEVFQPGPPIPDDGPLKLLCVARLIKRKGQHHLIQAVKQLTDQGVDVTLDLVGTGDAEEEYHAKVQSLGVEDRVRFRGYIPREEMPAVYAQAHVFVLPSFNEGMSVATLEAMAVGLPIVVTNTPGTEDLVHQKINGFKFKWKNIEELVGYINILNQNRSMTRKMGHQSITIAKKFSWRTSTECMQACIFSHIENYFGKHEHHGNRN